MKKYLVCMLIMISGLHVIATDLTPLSKYSTQWDYQLYQKANTAAALTYLSKEEKDLVFTINLARMNPWLFCKTVLLPYAEKNGYTTPLMTTMEQLKGTQQYGVIQVEAFFTEATRKWVQTENVKQFNGKEHSENLYLNDPMMKNGVLMFGDFKDSAELICKLIADQNSKQHSIRRYLTGNFNFMGLAIMNVNNKKVVSIVFNEQAALAFINPKGYELAVKQGKRPEDMEISYADFRDDSLMNYFARHPSNFVTEYGLISEDTFNYYKELLIKDGVEYKGCVLLSEARFNAIRDSIMEKRIAYVCSSSDYGIKINPLKSLNEQLYCVYDPDLNFKGSGSTSSYTFDHPIFFHFCCVKRSLAPNASGEYTITVQKLQSIPMHPMFKKDEIGVSVPEMNTAKIDSFAINLPKMPLKKLAHALADRYKRPEEKVRSLFVWMRHHLTYDTEGLKNGHAVYNAEEALQRGVAVCAGYTDLFQKFCEELKIPCQYISGFSDNGTVGLHAWNAVNISGKWYLIDVTWGYNYYLSSPDYFIKNHLPLQNRWTLLPEYYSVEKFLQGRTMDQ